MSIRLVLLHVRNGKAPFVERKVVHHYEITNDMKLVAYDANGDLLMIREPDQWSNLTAYRNDNISPPVAKVKSESKPFVLKSGYEI